MPAQLALNVHIYPSELLFTGRVFRITDYLRRSGWFSNVEIVGVQTGNLKDVETLPDGRIIRRFTVNKKRRTSSAIGRAIDFVFWYGRVFKYYRSQNIGSINAHSVSVLPLCWLLAATKRCKLVYEPHELETETLRSKPFIKAMLRTMERIFSRRAARVITVCSGISSWYERTYDLKDVGTIRNLPAATRAENPKPRGYFADLYGYAPTDLTFLYQGGISPGRGVEQLIDVFKAAPADRHIVFLGYGPLLPLVQDAVKQTRNIHYHQAVPNHELLNYTAAADVGLMMIENVSLSYYYCYPNKYCEYLTVGLPLVINEDLWLASEVRKYDCGWPVPQTVEGIGAFVRSVTRADMEAKRQGAERWARENNWPLEEKTLDEIYRKLFT